eukprot:3814507-Prymnesium_polylepis.1
MKALLNQSTRQPSMLVQLPFVPSSWEPLAPHLRMATCATDALTRSIPDGTGDLLVNLPVPYNGRLTHLKIEWAHAFNADLTFSVKTPAADGLQTLWSAFGGPSSGGSVTMSDGATPITSSDVANRASGPFGAAGQVLMLPGGILTAVKAGTWTLRVQDTSPGDTGTVSLFSICLIVLHPSPPPLPPPPSRPPPSPPPPV